MHDNPYHSPASNEFQPPNPAWGVPWGKIVLGLVLCGLLVALMLPARRGARSAAYKNSCRSNLKHIGLALEQYAENHGGNFPPAYTVDADGKPLHSWRTLLLPYLEQDALYKTIDLTKPWNDPVNARALNTVVAAYQCPSHTFESDMQRTTYLAMVTPQSVLRGGKSVAMSEIKDGTDKTIVVIEVPENYAVPWMSPQDADEALFAEALREGEPNADPEKRPQWTHMGNISILLFADGHVEETIPGDKTPAELRALITIAGGEK